MSPTDTETVLKYLVDKLDPADKSDLEAILGGEVDSLAADVMTGKLRIAADSMPESLKRAIRARTRPDHSAADQEYADAFPLAGWLR